MSDIAIRVEHLGKRYRIGKAQQRHDMLRDALVDGVHNLASALRTRRAANDPQQKADDEHFWALKDVSFEVKRGEVLGIIGRNGAGKSTLLKILSRITEPTEGRAILNGRVGSLLEVGTGFHPELTGRENIYLNGAMLGMRRAEIARRFDEIVAFAEIDKFLDTPVKRYSSGMYVRLAFAVAAHLQPEILLVDEVLAVGDAAFQKKCLGKMDDIANNGITILFVSHNLGAIAQMCTTCVLLKSGFLSMIGESTKVTQEYLNTGNLGSEVTLDQNLNPQSAAVFLRAGITNAQGRSSPIVDVLDPFCISITIHVRREVTDAEISVRIQNSLGQLLLTTNLSDCLPHLAVLNPGISRYIITVPGHFLAPDTYKISIAIHRPNIEILDNHEDLLSFKVEESGSKMWRYSGKQYGNILVDFPWQLNV